MSIFAKIDKSNVAVARLFFDISMDPLVGNDCPISIFSGLGGHGLSFYYFGHTGYRYCRPVELSLHMQYFPYCVQSLLGKGPRRRASVAAGK